MKGLTALAGGGADENDMPRGSALARLIFHLLNGMLGQGENRIQIDAESVAPLRVGHLIDAGIFGGPDTVIGNQDIEASEALDRGSDQIAGGFRTREIAGKRMTAIGAAFLNELPRLGCSLLVVENHVCARLDKKLYGGRAYAARATCD